MGSNATIQTNALYKARTIASSGQVLAVDATAGGVQLSAAAYPEGADTVKVNVQTADVRRTTDGSTPAPGSDHGDLIAAGSFLYLSHIQAKEAKFIRESGTSASIYSEALKY